MRWEDLFADLEGRARALAEAEMRAEIVDRTRGETSQVQLVNRLRAQRGRSVTIWAAGPGEVVGVVRRVATDHLLLDIPSSRGEVEALLVTHAVVTFADLAPGAIAPEAVGVVESRLGLASVLRGITADRSVVTVTTREGSQRHGTLAKVGADWVDLLVHAPDDVPRAGRVGARLTLPFSALAMIARRPGW
jgi:hypothetical protein